MKKILALALAIMLALSAVTVVWAEEEESNWVVFEPTNTNLVEEAGTFDADDWFATDYARAMLTVLLSLDLCAAFRNSSDPDLLAMSENWEKALLDSTYVGLGTVVLFVTYQYGDHSIHVYYSPFDGTAGYMINDAFTDSETEELLSSTCKGGYYRNRFSSISEVVSDLSGILSD